MRGISSCPPRPDKPIFPMTEEAFGRLLADLALRGDECQDKLDSWVRIDAADRAVMREVQEQ